MKRERGRNRQTDRPTDTETVSPLTAMNVKNMVHTPWVSASKNVLARPTNCYSNFTLPQQTACLLQFI